MLFGLTNTLRSLTNASPITTAINEAHRMARRRLEAGGAAAASVPKRARPSAAVTDFILPPDVDAEEVRKAIAAKLGDGASPGSLGKNTQKHARSGPVFGSRSRISAGFDWFDPPSEFRARKNVAAGRLLAGFCFVTETPAPLRLPSAG